MLITRTPWKLAVAAKLIGLSLFVLAIAPDRAFSDSPSPGPHIVMIIRHAEKPAATDGEKDPNLSKQGYERAEALAKVFPEHFPHPDYLIAAKKSKGSNRPVETITPLSKALHEEIDSNFQSDDCEGLAHALKTDPKYAGKVVLISWRHGKIPELAKALGAKNVPAKWQDDVFNRVWEIEYKKGAASWKDLPENAMPGDAKEADGAKPVKQAP
jgi:broad specificity phosphatase PhoE